MENLNITMTSKETLIYEGLKSIRPEIAAFYMDGIALKNIDFSSKSNVLAHLLREIEGGLRDIYKISEEEKGGDKEEGKHKKDIIKAFNIDESSNFADKYLYVTGNLHKFAHRSGKAVEAPRGSKEIIILWTAFEDIMYELVGTYLSNARLLDVLLSRDIPNKDTLRRLHIILRDHSKNMYFYLHLDKIGWLAPLHSKGIFNGSNNLNPLESPDSPGYFSYPYWYELQYVCRIAGMLELKQDNEWIIIRNIIKSVFSYKDKNGERIINPRTYDMLIYLISALPDKYLKEEHLNYIKEISTITDTSMFFSFGNKLIPKFIKDKNKEYLLKCLDILFHFRENEDADINYSGIFDSMSIKSNMEHFRTQIVDICKIDGCNILLEKLNKLKDDPSLLLPIVDEHDSQNKYKDNYSSCVIFNIIDYILLMQDEEIKIIVNNLLKLDISSKRVAYYVIAKKYSLLKDIYWSLHVNPMNEISCYPELYLLLKNNCKTFSEHECQQCLDWIEAIEIPQNEDGEYPENIVLSFKKMYVILTFVKHVIY